MSHISLQRQWKLLEALHGRRRGLAVRALLERLGTSKATLYRDLRLLQEAGFPIAKEEGVGEIRYLLLGEPMPAVQPTVWQVLALRLARSMLAPLQGSKILRELDALLPRKAPLNGRAPVVQVPPPRAVGGPSIVAVVEQSIDAGRRVTFMYAAATRGAPSQRRVDPLALHVNDGQLYLDAFDVDRGAIRTFKFARIASARMLEEKVEPHPEYDNERILAHAAKVWDGPLVDVEVRISPRGARFVTEWPLVASQRIEAQEDGSVVVRARVAGIVEALRWVLRWGKDAVALAPADLRAAVQEELRQAIDHYDEEGLSER